MRRASGPKPVAVLGERRVPTALQNLHHRLLDESIQHRRDAKLAHPAVWLGDFHPLHRLRLIGPAQQLFPDGLASAASGAPATAGRSSRPRPALPLLALTRFNACLQILPLADLLHQPFGAGRAFGSALRRGRFGPFPRGPRGFTPTLLREGQTSSWFFCRLSPMSRALLATPFPCGDRSGLHGHGSASTGSFGPSEECAARHVPLLCPLLTSAARSDRSLRSLSPDSGTDGRSPEVSRPPSAHNRRIYARALMDMDFAVICPLVRTVCLYPVLVHRLARLLHASFRPRLAATPLRFAILHLHQVGQGDFHPRAVEHARHTNTEPGAYVPG